MKKYIVFTVFASCALVKGQDLEYSITTRSKKIDVPPSASEPEQNFIKSEVFKEFSKAKDKAPNLKKNFSNPLGWTLWKTPGASLSEVTTLTSANPQHAAVPENGEEAVYTVGDKDSAYSIVYDPAKNGFKKLSLKDFAAWGLKARMGIRTNGKDGGSAVMVSVRDSFSYFNANQGGFAVDYTNKDGDSSWKTKGAVMMDFYLDPLYNRPKAWWGSEPYRFTLRTGVEFDRDDTATQPTDLTSVYLLGSFQANSDQNARLLGIKSLPQILSPQFVQIGVAYDHDGITNKDDTRLILGWQPQFYLLKDIAGMGETFGINRKMIYKAGSFASLLKPSEVAPVVGKNGKIQEKSGGTNGVSNWYSYIPADLRLSGGSEIWKRALGTDGDLNKVFLEWKGGFVVGNSEQRFRFGYLIEGVSPVAELGKTHVGHSLFAEIALGNVSEEYRNQQRTNARELGLEDYKTTPLIDTDLGAMTVFAKYTMGQFAPAFEDHDIFQIGTRIRF